MNYFLNNYYVIVYFLSAIIFAILIIIICFSLICFANHFSLSKKWLAVIIFVSVFGSMLLYGYLLVNVPDYLNDGKIRYVFFQEQNNETRLVTWFTRIDRPAGMSTVYSHRLKSYDLNNGKQLGRENLLRRYYTNDYKIYGPFGNKAWGYSKKSGVQLLDFYKPKILFNNEDILQKNPQLGSLIRIYDAYNYPVYDPVSHGLYVVNATGNIYRITPDLQAVFVGDIKIDKVNYDQRRYPEWIFEEEKGINSKTVHIKGIKLSDKSKIFISPEIVEYWDDDSLKLGKIWIEHWSTNSADADCLLSYVNKNGEELNCINITQFFKNKKAKSYFTLLHDNEIYLFITRSYYTLTALRTEIKKGNMLGRIDYNK